MSKQNGKQNIKLTSAEQKTTAAFKMLTAENKSLRQSLKRVQDELEGYRERYHEADKNHAVLVSKHTTVAFHEFLKFVVSTVCGGVGVNLLTDGHIFGGVIMVITGLVLFALIVFVDKK